MYNAKTNVVSLANQNYMIATGYFGLKFAIFSPLQNIWTKTVKKGEQSHFFNFRFKVIFLKYFS